jgi:hypothetical protein
LLEGLDEVEGGECAPWDPVEDRKVLEEMIRRRREAGIGREAGIECDFAEAAEKVLRKNAELYRRLA